MREKRTVYLAYGSNLNIEQMTRRCPDAKPWGATVLRDYRLTFWGGCGHAVATIIPNEGSFVPVALWSITPADEQALDVYEGYPRLYRKEYLRLKWGGRYVRAMVYIMNHGAVNIPSRGYFTTILDGYEDFGIDTKPLFQALWEAEKTRSKP
ncbi:MAG: gamma-glutamylcyclotransferase [Oscillospiraceae bacterium]|jgi:hypothetical protein|nr:gamma-glutamylcyclotransferase [Oscillospiraceae bacterium]